MAKIFYEKVVPVLGVPTLVLFNVTTVIGNQGAFAKQLAGVGNKFWWFASVPVGPIIGCDFTDAPIVTTDAAANNALIAAITVEPTDVLTYAE